MKHPAVYSHVIILELAKLLAGCSYVLDPCAGTGKLALIKEYGYMGKIICNELEPEWANCGIYDVDEWHIGDAAKMDWCASSSIGAICTSPTYGNRMADHHNAKDASRRITYRHTLGRPLHPQNTGQMQFGERYQAKHLAIYTECYRVLRPGGIIIVNVSNHIRGGKVVDVVDWHRRALMQTGFDPTGSVDVITPRMGFGANRNIRVEGEQIIVYTLPE